jgi:hypothetical protein
MRKKLMSIVITAAIMVNSMPVFAKSFNSKQGIPLNHSWSVKLNKTLGSNQDFSGITIKDTNGTIVPVSVTIGVDNKSLTIAPKENYSSNTSYVLTVDGVKDSNGNKLKENATLNFSTTSAISSIIQPTYIEGAENRADRVWSNYFESTLDEKGQSIPFDSYTLGQVYTYEQAQQFEYSFKYNPDYDHMDVICGLGCQMKFEQGKLYVEKSNPINVKGDPYGWNYGVGKMVRYTNPINPLAEQQIYDLVSNVAKADDVNNKYMFIYNGQYGNYKADSNGNLVKIKDNEYHITDFYLELVSNENDKTTGHVINYGDVIFLENPYVVNNKSYNLRLSINPVVYPKETDLILKSVLGDKLSNDLSETLTKRINNDITHGEFSVDNVSFYADDSNIYISY